MLVQQSRKLRAAAAAGRAASKIEGLAKEDKGDARASSGSTGEHREDASSSRDASETQQLGKKHSWSAHDVIAVSAMEGIGIAGELCVCLCVFLGMSKGI